MKNIFLLLLFLIMNQAFATKPTVARRSKKARKKIEMLRYKNKEDYSKSEKKLVQNFKRDCVGYAYHNEDLDLNFSLVYRSYPKKVRTKILKKHLISICPTNLVQALTIEKDKETASLSRRYLRSHKGDQYWPYTSGAEVMYLVGEMSKSCLKGDVVALKKIYCLFQVKSPKDSYLGLMTNKFKEKCQEYETTFVCAK